MVNGPSVLGCAGARGQARHEHIKVLAAEPIAQQRGCFAHVTHAHRDAKKKLGAISSRELAFYTRTGPNKANYLAPSAQQRANVGLADGACGTNDEDAAGQLSLPLNRGRRLATHVVGHAINSTYLIDDAA